MSNFPPTYVVPVKQPETSKQSNWRKRLVIFNINPTQSLSSLYPGFAKNPINTNTLPLSVLLEMTYSDFHYVLMELSPNAMEEHLYLLRNTYPCASFVDGFYYSCCPQISMLKCIIDDFDALDKSSNERKFPRHGLTFHKDINMEEFQDVIVKCIGKHGSF